MAKPVKIIHSGKTIYYMDFSNLVNAADIKNLIDESIIYVRNQPPLSVFTLTNIEGMHFSNEIKEIFNDFIKGNKPYVKTGAVVGLNGLQKILYNGLMKVTGRDIRSFNTLEEAKEWLAGTR